MLDREATGDSPPFDTAILAKTVLFETSLGGFGCVGKIAAVVGPRETKGLLLLHAAADGHDDEVTEKTGEVSCWSEW